MDTQWTYYEYADDLLARVAPNANGAFEIFVKGKWKPCVEMLKFSFTAQKITDMDLYLKRNPDLRAAVDPKMQDRLSKAAEKSVSES